MLQAGLQRTSILGAWPCSLTPPGSGPTTRTRSSIASLACPLCLRSDDRRVARRARRLRSVRANADAHAARSPGGCIWSRSRRCASRSWALMGCLQRSLSRDAPTSRDRTRSSCSSRSSRKSEDGPVGVGEGFYDRLCERGVPARPHAPRADLPLRQRDAGGSAPRARHGIEPRAFRRRARDRRVGADRSPGAARGPRCSRSRATCHGQFPTEYAALCSRAGPARVRADGGRRPRVGVIFADRLMSRAAARRRRAAPAVDARQGRGAGLGRAHRRHRRPRRPPAARAADRPRPRHPRGRDPAPVRRLDGARRRGRSAGRRRASAARPRPRRRCSDLRSALQRPLGRAPRATADDVRGRGRAAARAHPDLGVTLEAGGVGDVPPALEPLAQIGPAPRPSATRTSTRDPTRVSVRIGRDRRRIRARGRQRRRRRQPRHAPGMGLRLAALEALQSGGVVEFGEREPGTWQVRLVVPADDEATRCAARAAARARRRRSRRRPLGLPADADPAAVGRALPERALEASEAVELARPLPPARGARRPVHRRGVGRRGLRAAARGRAD